MKIMVTINTSGYGLLWLGSKELFTCYFCYLGQQ